MAFTVAKFIFPEPQH